MRAVKSLVIAFSTYSRIPMPQVEWSDENRKYTMCFFPLIGLAVGCSLWLWLYLCDAWQLGKLLRGSVCALLPLLITGGIHMDGLMDTCDALASWQTRERRLEILKDSHTGAFAVMGCAGYLLLQCAVFSEADTSCGPMLAAAFMLSRALSAWTLAHFKSARPGGMMDAFARTAHRRLVTGSTAVYGLLCLLLFGLHSLWLALLCLAAAGACTLYYRQMAYKHFGGITGDLAGWFVQVTELVLALGIVVGGKIL